MAVTAQIIPLDRPVVPQKIIPEIIENHSEFLVARIATINLFQIYLDEP